MMASKDLVDLPYLFFFIETTVTTDGEHCIKEIILLIYLHFFLASTDVFCGTKTLLCLGRSMKKETYNLVDMGQK